ncbi:MAG: DMT family transporter [Clostridiales bacterium]|nr:DMT family transporter [Candidatus Crickella equi]
MSKGKVTAISLIVLQSALYGLGDPISKAAFDTVPLFRMLTLRYCIALVVMLIIWGKPIIAGLKNAKIRDWIVPVLCMGGAYVSNNVALLLTQATTVAFIRSLPTVIAPILAFLVFRRHYGKKLIVVQVFVVIGLYMLCCGKGGLGNGFGLGEVFALLAAVLLAASLVYGEKSLDRVDPLTLTALMVFASAAMAVVGMLFANEVQTKPMTITVWAIIIYLAVLCTIAGYLLQNIALKDISSSTVAVVQCLCPVMTAVFSLFILGERISMFGAVGAVIILVCLVAAVYLDKPVEDK